MYKIIDDKNTFVFLEPIPKWITHFGYVIMVGLFILVIVGTSFVRYPQVITVPVSIRYTESYAEIDFTTFDLLSKERIDYMEVNIPTLENSYKTRFLVDDAMIIDDVIKVPIELEKSVLDKLVFEKSITTTGSVILSNESLLSKVMSTIF